MLRRRPLIGQVIKRQRLFGRLRPEAPADPAKPAG